MTIVTVAGEYDVAAEVLWRHVVRYDSLARMMSGPLVRVACPEGEEQAGHDVTLTFKLLGLVPVGRWRFVVVERGDVNFRLRSAERGSGVRRWDHEVKIVALEPSRSRLTDTIEIEAGALTPLVAWFARREYARRHRLRKRMVKGPRTNP